MRAVTRSLQDDGPASRVCRAALCCAVGLLVSAPCRAAPDLIETEIYIKDHMQDNIIDFGNKPAIGFDQTCILTIYTDVYDPNIGPRGVRIERTTSIDFHHIDRATTEDGNLVIKSYHGETGSITLTTLSNVVLTEPTVRRMDSFTFAMLNDQVAERMATAINHLEKLCGSAPKYDPFAKQ